MTRRVRRETSYESPFGGARTQTVEEFERIHWRWIDLMDAVPNPGVPSEPYTLERCRVCLTPKQQHQREYGRSVCRTPDFETVTRPGRVTFGYPGEGPDGLVRYDEGGACVQCGGCARYVPLESRLGMDWGACTSPDSPFDGRVVFEHSSCPYFDDGERRKEARDG